MKKLIAVLLVLAMVFSFAACGGDDSGDAPDYKIGIITGTKTQGEEEFLAAEQMKAKYGDMIVTATYPDNFSTETEQTISTVTSMAADEAVKAIVFVQAVPGASAAIDKVRETRPDMLFICGVCAEDPAVIASKADICMLVDEIAMGRTIIEQAAAMGAKTFIHYSFARHLSYATIAARREGFIETCKEKGIEFVDVNAPDPTGDSGTAGAQQFILEDVPRQVAQYGTDTAFFSTNCGMQEPLIRSVLEQKAIFPQQCCPSPYHGYPAALSIKMTGHEGDVAWMLEQIKAKVEAGGNSGRMSTWPVAINMSMIQAGVEYAIKFCEGQTTGAFDEALFTQTLEGVVGTEHSVTVSKYVDAEKGEINNFLMLLCDFYTF